MRNRIIVATAAIFVISGYLEANGPPIHGDTAFVVGIEGAGIRSFYQEMRMDRLLRDGEKIADPQDWNMIVRMVPFMLPYETIPNRLLIGFAVPYLDKRMEMTNAGQKIIFTNKGLGDTTFFSKYQFYQKDRQGGTTRITGKFGLKLPTGKNDARDETGTLLSTSLQLGSGSWDISGGIVATHLYQRWGINTNLVYNLNTEDGGFEAGDVFQYDISGTMRLLPFVYEEYPSPQLNLILELNGKIAVRNKQGGVSDINSGGHSWLFSPGLQFIGGRDWLIDVSYQLPLVQNLRGTQLGLSRTLTAGFLVYLRR